MAGRLYMGQNKKNMILLGGAILGIILLFLLGVKMRIDGTNKPEEQEAPVLREDEVAREELYRIFAYFEYSSDEIAELMAVHKGEIGTGSLCGYALRELGAITKEDYERENNPISVVEFSSLLSYFTQTDKEYSEAVKIGEQVYHDLLETKNQNEETTSSAKREDVWKTCKAIFDGLAKQESIKQTYPTNVTLLFLGKEEDSSKLVTQLGTFEIATDHSISEPKKIVSYSCLVYGNEILWIGESVDEEIQIPNIYIKQGEGEVLTVFLQGIEREFQTIYPLSKSIANVVGDITIEDSMVTKINIKPDTITAKVLMTGTDYIELEDYGRINLDEDFRIYQVYDGLAMEKTSRILVGYEATDFVVSGDKICAALITEEIKAKNIRVLLMTDEFRSYYHDNIQIKCEGAYTVSYGEEEEHFAAGASFTIHPDDERLKDNRVFVRPDDEDDKLCVQSIKRSGEAPSYRGHLEIVQDERGMFLVNEVSLEEYLYAVIPSEMPTYYGSEALKVQAVCARSYAYTQLKSNAYAAYGAHVDDSTACQVYNNVPENESTILAVKETYGQVLEYQGEIITAYYYSTSAGYSNYVEDVWIGARPAKYLEGKWQISMDSTKEVMALQKKAKALDLTKNDDFFTFLKDDTIDTYDKQFSWYRWTTTLKASDYENRMLQVLKDRYQVNPALILTKGKDKKDTTYESKEISSIGTLEKIEVKKRAESGMVMELLLVGSKATIKVISEYNIRMVLAPIYDTLILKDGSKKENFSILPSAFFALETTKKDGAVEEITLYGGGYGHGVGMSQNGVKAMVMEGYTYDKIISYYYNGTVLTDIYS